MMQGTVSYFLSWHALFQGIQHQPIAQLAQKYQTGVSTLLSLTYEISLKHR